MNKKLLAAGLSILALGACYGIGYLQGSSRVQSKWDQTTTMQLEQDQKVLLMGMKDSFEIGVAHEQQKEVIRYVTDEIIREIPVYIKSDTCPKLPDGFSMLYNRSAQAINDSVTASQSNGTAGTSGVNAR